MKLWWMDKCDDYENENSKIRNVFVETWTFLGHGQTIREKLYRRFLQNLSMRRRTSIALMLPKEYAQTKLSVTNIRAWVTDDFASAYSFGSISAIDSSSAHTQILHWASVRFCADRLTMALYRTTKAPTIWYFANISFTSVQIDNFGASISVSVCDTQSLANKIKSNYLKSKNLCIYYFTLFHIWPHLIHITNYQHENHISF